MGLFDGLAKMGLIEHNVDDIPIPVHTEEVPEVEANAEINSTENVISEIYAQNSMSDKENSIYAVQSFIDTLPSEMTTAKKQSSVFGILKVTGKSVDTLLRDAMSRINLLATTKEMVFIEKDNVINAAKADIEELKKEIEQREALIQEAENIKESVAKSVADETSNIEELVKFCEGMGDSK